MSVDEAVEFFAAHPSIHRCLRLLQDVGLGYLTLGQQSPTLSGGEAQRIKLVYELSKTNNSRTIYVLDEPTVGQDPVLRDELWRRFRKLANEGATLLVSSHVMDEANRCDRLLLIRDGSIIADDSPTAVKEAAGTDDLDEAFLRLVRRQPVGGR